MKNVLNTKIIFASFVTLFAIFMVLIQPPIAQDIQYHIFADERTFFSIPNFYNVFSNAPFLVVGFIGIYDLFFSKQIIVINEQKMAVMIFFTGVSFVAFGSGYYHLSPDNTSLLWDRLPMTIAFMALFSKIISELISTKFSQYILGSLLIFGLYSVLYWHVTELNGEGDLRLYILVQFLPMLLIPIFLVQFRGVSKNISGYWLLLICYAVAKLCEYFDREIFHLLGVISGHSLKHIMAAIGVLFLLLAYRKPNSGIKLIETK